MGNQHRAKDHGGRLNGLEHGKSSLKEPQPQGTPRYSFNTTPVQPISSQSGTRLDRLDSRAKSLRRELADGLWPPLFHAHGREGESEAEESDGFSESSSDQDGDWVANDESDSWDPDTYRAQNELAADHEYQALRPGLVQWTYDRFCEWAAAVHYDIPPGYRQLSHKLAKAAARKPQEMYSLKEDPEDPQITVVSHIDGYFHLACPFYRHNPIRYHQCVCAHDLQSIEDVIIHLKQYHKLPAYCPTCYTTFVDARMRNDHVRGGTCEYQQSITIEGIDRYQMSKILRRDDPFVREDIRWLRIFSGAFPTSDWNHSPYLTDGLGFYLSLLQDYLSGQGYDYVSQYLQSHSLTKRTPEHYELVALHSLTLEQLTEKIIHSHGNL